MSKVDPNELPVLPLYILEWVMKNEMIHDDSKLWLEFGVWKGNTINFISKWTGKPVFGFDSFFGLPEDWTGDGGIILPKSTFTLEGNLPKVNDNVILIKGLFEDTLDRFLEFHTDGINFIHMDADLYTSTKYVLTKLVGQIVPGCVIVFDELFGFNGWDSFGSEWRALSEWTTENRVKWEWIGICGQFNQRAAIRIISIG